MSESKRFLENISSNYFIFVLKIVAGIYALPVCLHAFGAEQYGLYIIFFGLATSLAAFDFGSSKSVFRYTVEFHADGDKQKYQQAMSAGISYNLYAALIIALFMLLIGYFSRWLFNLSQEVAEEAGLLIILAAINAFIITLSAVPQNLLTAHKLFLFRNKFQLIIILLNILMIAGIQFTSSISLNQYAILTTIVTAISFIGDVIMSYNKQLIKGLHITFLRGSSIFKSPFSGYSLQVFLLSLVSFLAVQADRFIIASVLDVASVTIYTIITKPYFVLRGVNAISYPVVQPILTRLNLATDKNNYVAFTAKIGRVGFLFMLSVTVITAIFYHQVLIIWLGTSAYNQYIEWGVLSLITLCITMIYNAHFRTLLHTNYIHKILQFSLFSVLGNIIISIMLSKTLGFQGVIIGTFVQIIAELIFTGYIFKKHYSTAIKAIKTSWSYVSILLSIIVLAFGVNYLEITFAHTLLEDLCFFLGLTILLALLNYWVIKKENVFGQFSAGQLTSQPEIQV